MGQYKIEFEPTEKDKPEALKGLLVGYLWFFDKQPEISQRLKEDRLIESDLFFLKGYCHRVRAYRNKKYQFLKVS